MDQILIFDTTLRDGEQSPGATMTRPEKLRVARALEQLGVDVIEAGFPISSPEEFASVRAIAEAVRGPIIAALARARDGDVDRAVEAVCGAERPRVHTFLATSDLHLSRKLGITRDEALARIDRSVRRASRQIGDVEFSAEDATRTDPAFLCQVVQTAIQAGATTINIPDTVGYAQPEDFTRIIEMLRAEVDGIDRIVLSVHGHDDLGLAVANSLAAIQAGARQVECTINGIGERAGNASLEEVVMALRVLPGMRDSFRTGVRAERVCPTSELLTHVTGIRPQPNKAIVGANAFAHEAGIHQDGMLKDPATYEIMTPEMVGARGSSLVLGKHSGRAALLERYRELGFDLTPEESDRAYRLFVLLAEQKKVVRDEDLVAIYYRGSMEGVERSYRLDHLDVRCGRSPSTATLRVSRRDDPPIEAEATGDGPIAAAYTALDSITPWPVQLEEFDIHAAGSGKDAVGEVHLQLRARGHVYHGSAASTDIVDAAVRAYLHALDKAEHTEQLEARSFEATRLWGV